MTMKTMKRLSIWLVLVICVCGAAAWGDVRLPKVFTDHMVLQQDLPIGVWGWADKGQAVSVTLAGKSAETKAGAAGKWRVDIPPMKADGKAHTLTVKGAKVIVKFKYAGGGLASRDGKALNWFELSDGAMENRKLKFVKAAARIVGKDTIEVTAPETKSPKFIRFAWNCEARHNLMNKETLPAVSFKTDEPLAAAVAP